MQTGRLFVVLLTVVAYVIALRAPQSIFDLAIQYAFSGYAALSPLLVAALFWKRSTKWGALAVDAVVGLRRGLHRARARRARLGRPDAGCADDVHLLCPDGGRVVGDAASLARDDRQVPTVTPTLPSAPIANFPIVGYGGAISIQRRTRRA